VRPNIHRLRRLDLREIHIPCNGVEESDHLQRD
jgi:hypothetical protein